LFNVAIALLKSFVTALVRLMPEGIDQHFECGFGQQLARFAGGWCEPIVLWPAPHHFLVAVPALWADDWKHDE
jgi:hypothetical protein